MDRTMGAIAVGSLVVSTGVGMYQANQLKQDAKGIAGESKIEREKQEAALNKQKDEYKAMKFKNPFQGMENTFEDLTVNQQQAQFQSQQGNQQRANVMQNMKGAAGSSGIAGLAQAMANQGQLQTQRISASIGAQESQNQMASARGATAVQNAERQGDQWVQQAEMQMGQTTGANAAYQQSQANQMNAQIAQNQVLTDGLSNIATTGIKAAEAGLFDKPETP